MSCGPVREGMKTIRQIADEIGVSKTAVNKQIANLGLRSGLRKNGNQFAIDEHQEALIKQAFSEKSQTEIENQSQTKTQTENHEVGDLVCVLQATIDTLQGQLEVKDRQIAKLTEALVERISRSRNRKKAGFQKFLVVDRKQKDIFFVTTSRKGGVIQ